MTSPLCTGVAAAVVVVVDEDDKSGKNRRDFEVGGAPGSAAGKGFRAGAAVGGAMSHRVRPSRRTKKQKGSCCCCC